MTAETGGHEVNEAETSSQQAVTEITRQRGVIDMTLSMQAQLRDWNGIVGTGLTLSILAASSVGVAFAFAGTSQDVTLLGITADRSSWLGWLAVTTATLTLMDLVLDRRGATARRSEAVKLLGELKGQYRVTPTPGTELAESTKLSSRYEAAMGAVPAIPNKLFNHLKASHLLKVEVSKVLSEHPGMSNWKARRTVRKRYRI